MSEHELSAEEMAEDQLAYGTMFPEMRVREAVVTKRVKVRCPGCGAIEDTAVIWYRGDPWPTYGCTCQQCGYEIIESEWEEVAK